VPLLQISNLRQRAISALTRIPSSTGPNHALLDKLAPVRRICLLAAAALAALILAAWFIPALGSLLPPGWDVMRCETALFLILSAISLELSESRYSSRYNRIGQSLAVLVALYGAAVLLEFALHISLGIDTLLPCDQGTGDPFPGRPAAQTAGGLFLLGVSANLIRARHRIVIWTADLAAIALALLVLILFTGEIFNALHLFSFSTRIHTSLQTLTCLILLTSVALLRRAERGVLSIFLGCGIGATTARVLGPVLIVLPIFREITRVHVINARIIPEHYVTAILTSIATALSMILLWALVWRINSMEMEIHVLSLRDELTGLNNLRGFSLLSEQVLRLAQRSQLPLSVLFIDLDHLKQINDSFGHDVGSAFLVEMAEILKQTFRETDVIGRVGGDEFAVVCQGSHVAISVAAQRLQAACALRNAESDRQFPLSFSVGFVTAEEHAHQSLKELLTEADKAMYEEKRRKKLERD
jgi:diguanylate cyclase (GGDEF)-like protein